MRALWRMVSLTRKLADPFFLAEDSILASDKLYFLITPSYRDTYDLT